MDPAANRDGDTGATLKRFRAGTERSVEPAVTLARARRVMAQLGITRIATTTHLDRVGVPVVAAYRPNSRSLAVSQGKGPTLAAAQASAIMEAIECYHAEHIVAPLLLGSARELRARHEIVDVSGLPRVSACAIDADCTLLWAAGVEMLTGRRVLVPYDVVHLDFRVPLPAGSGAFMMSSNGLASGNDISEAISHGLCELVERDANTVWSYADADAFSRRRIDLSTVDDEACREVLGRFEAAGVAVAVWDTTTDVGIPCFMCIVVDRDPRVGYAIQAVAGSGCHPRRAIALSRALTEAAQGRVTIISGARDDLASRTFQGPEAVARAGRERERILGSIGKRRFGEVPDVPHDDFESDVEWELRCLRTAGLEQVVVVNLSKTEVGIPVVRVVVPYLEGISEVPGYVPGPRARRYATEAPS